MDIEEPLVVVTGAGLEVPLVYPPLAVLSDGEHGAGLVRRCLPGPGGRGLRLLAKPAVGIDLRIERFGEPSAIGGDEPSLMLATGQSPNAACALGAALLGGSLLGCRGLGGARGASSAHALILRARALIACP